LFDLQQTLLSAQQTHVDRIETCVAAGLAILPIEQQLYDQATASIALAAQAQEASDTDEADGVVPGTYTGQGNSPDDDPDCSRFRQAVRDAKAVVRTLSQCRLGMNNYELLLRKDAWLNLATARSTYHQRCWAGGNETHQNEEAIASQKVGACDALLR